MSGRKLGFKFYSHYLNSNCRVTRYFTDKHWWFYSEKHGYEMKAGTRLSYFKGQEDEKIRQSVLRGLTLSKSDRDFKEMLEKGLRMKKFIIELITDDDVTEKAIDTLLQSGADLCLVDIIDWDVEESYIE